MKLVTPPKSKREIKIELTGSKNIGMSICLGCGGNPVGAFGICAGCNGSGYRHKIRKVNPDSKKNRGGCTLIFIDYCIIGLMVAIVFSAIFVDLTT